MMELEHLPDILREAPEVREQGPDSRDEPAVSLQHALLHLLHVEGQCVLVHILHATRTSFTIDVIIDEN
jgi:hypothetical protein